MRPRPPRDSASPEEEHQWKEELFIYLVTEKNERMAALASANRLRGVEDPQVDAVDLETSKPYLKTCISNKRQRELIAMPDRELAFLWARGALGAARYRARAGEQRRTGRRKRGQ